MGIMGVDTDPALLARLGVEVRDGVRFDEVVGLLGKARFAPVFHRPLFRHWLRHEPHLRDLLCGQPARPDAAARFRGGDLRRAALKLVPGDDVAAHLDDALSQPEAYWDAVLQTRSHLAQHHSYAQRFEELAAFTTVRAEPGRRAVNILFVMKHRGNAGNTHAVANYMRLAPKYGHAVAIFGTPIWYVPELQFSTDIRNFDRVMYVYESELYRIGRMSEAVMLARFPQAAPADHGHRRNVQSRGHDRRLRLQPSRTRPSGPLDRSPRCARRPDHANHHRAPINPRAQRHDVLRIQSAPCSSIPSASPPKQYDILHRRSQLVAMERGVTRAAAGVRADPRPDRARSPSSACGGMRLRPRGRRRDRRRLSSPTRKGSDGCGSRRRRR